MPASAVARGGLQLFSWQPQTRARRPAGATASEPAAPRAASGKGTRRLAQRLGRPGLVGGAQAARTAPPQGPLSAAAALDFRYPLGTLCSCHSSRVSSN
jgi:hypothetical protein